MLREAVGRYALRFMLGVQGIQAAQVPAQSRLSAAEGLGGRQAWVQLSTHSTCQPHVLGKTQIFPLSVPLSKLTLLPKYPHCTS